MEVDAGARKLIRWESGASSCLEDDLEDADYLTEVFVVSEFRY